MPEGSRNYIPKPEGWISFAELEKDSNETPVATSEKDSYSTILPIFEQLTAPTSSSSSAKLSECDDNIISYNNESAEPSESNDVLNSKGSKSLFELDEEEAKNEHETDSLEDALERAEPIPVVGVEMELGEHVLETTGKIDQRKFNRGQAKRKSYE